jgi:hypothetical protein
VSRAAARRPRAGPHQDEVETEQPVDRADGHVAPGPRGHPDERRREGLGAAHVGEDPHGGSAPRDVAGEAGIHECLARERLGGEQPAGGLRVALEVERAEEAAPDVVRDGRDRGHDEQHGHDRAGATQVPRRRAGEARALRRQHGDQQDPGLRAEAQALHGERRRAGDEQERAHVAAPDEARHEREAQEQRDVQPHLGGQVGLREEVSERRDRQRAHLVDGRHHLGVGRHGGGRQQAQAEGVHEERRRREDGDAEPPPESLLFEDAAGGVRAEHREAHRVLDAVEVRPGEEDQRDPGVEAGPRAPEALEQDQEHHEQQVRREMGPDVERPREVEGEAEERQRRGRQALPPAQPPDEEQQEQAVDSTRAARTATTPRRPAARSAAARTTWKPSGSRSRAGRRS